MLLIGDLYVDPISWIYLSLVCMKLIFFVALYFSVVSGITNFGEWCRLPSDPFFSQENTLMNGSMVMSTVATYLVDTYFSHVAFIGVINYAFCCLLNLVNSLGLREGIHCLEELLLAH